jgi:hypothetical protein
MEEMKIKNQRRELTCWLANFLVNKRGFDRSKAFKCAHAIYRLTNELAKGLLEFSYMKDDGTLRHARGTLCDGVSDRFDEWKRKQAEKPMDKKAKAKTKPREIITYWDLDKEGFRSFRADRLIEVISEK